MEKNPGESAIIGRVQMVLAEKRTSLSVLRTGMAILTLPISIVTLLIATSRFYDFTNNLHFLIPLFVVNTILVLLGFWLVGRALKRIHSFDKFINDLKKQDKELGKLIIE